MGYADYLLNLVEEEASVASLGAAPNPKVGFVKPIESKWQQNFRKLAAAYGRSINRVVPKLPRPVWDEKPSHPQGNI